MNEVDQLVRRRAYILMLSAFCFAAWQGAWLASDIAADQSTLFFLASVITTFAAIGWAIAMLAFVLFGKKVARLRGKAVIDDELTRQNRFRAFSYGWVFTLLFVSVGVGAETLWSGTAYISLRLAQIAAVSAPMYAFARMELVNLQEE